MKRGLVLGALMVVGALLAALGAQSAILQTRPPTAIQVDKIKDNLYVLRGGGGNTAAFITTDGVVLVDTKLPGWGKPILDVVNSWKVPERFLENGYLTPDAYQKLAGKPISERLRANVEVVWKETK